METIRLSENLEFTNQVKLIDGEVYYQIRSKGVLHIPLLNGMNVPVPVGCIGGWVGKNTILNNSWVDRDSTIINSTAENTMIKNSIVKNTVIEDAFLYKCNTNSSTIVYSKIQYATLFDANIYNSYNTNHNGLHSTELKLRNNVTVEDSHIEGRWVEVSNNVTIRNSVVNKTTTIRDGSFLQDTILQQGSYIESSSLTSCDLVKPRLIDCMIAHQSDTGYYDKPLFRDRTVGVRAFK
jgi:ADP-glucose pyrophosphorylase